MTDSVLLPTGIFLSSQKLPSTGMTYLSDREIQDWLEGWLTFWKPENLLKIEGIPQIGGPYDYDPPRPDHTYLATPATLALLPSDWPERARSAGCVLLALADENQGSEESAKNPYWFAAKEGQVFQSLGYGFAWLEAFCESQDHPNLLDVASFTAKVRAALAFWQAGDFEALEAAAADAAALLVQARESVTSSALFHVDLILAEAIPSGVQEETAWLEGSIVRNLIASGLWLENLEKKDPKTFRFLREQADKGMLEVAGGLYLERDEPLRSVESQLWNLRKGKTIYESLLGQPVKTFARTKAGLHPLMPLLLHKEGIRRALLISFDEASMPHYRSPVISWAGSDGRSVEALARVPLPAESPQTWFHMAYHLGRAVREDHAPTIVLVHRDEPTPLYRLVTQLASLGPVMGRWVGLDAYFNEASPAEYPGVTSWDDYTHDWLAPENRDSADGVNLDPVSSRASTARKRRRMDAAYTLSAIREILDKGAPQTGWKTLREELARAEDGMETGEDPGAADSHLERASAALAERLLGGRPPNPGFMVFNPCAFTRRVALETQGIDGYLEIDGPVKAFQKDGETSRVVVEVPSLGYAWIPSKGGPPKPPPRARLRLADEKTVRNEFFEAEIDTETGAIRAFRDVRFRQNRLVHQLTYLPGGRMKLTEVKVGSSGPALGELTCKGEITDEQGEILATYTQRLRAWIGRPVLEIAIDLEPIRPPSGYPWHAAYGARFSVPTGGSTLSRGALGMVEESRHNRPLSAEFLEWKQGSSNVALLSGGMPFLQRHGASQLDLILIAPGETATHFEYGLCMDRNHLEQIAHAMISPAPLVQVDRGPPAAGASAWLFHPDLANVLMGEFRIAEPENQASSDFAPPVHEENGQAEGPSEHPGLTIRLQECEGQYSIGELRCFRAPRSASSLDSDGYHSMGLSIHEDGIQLEIPRREMTWIRLDW